MSHVGRSIALRSPQENVQQDDGARRFLHGYALTVMLFFFGHVRVMQGLAKGFPESLRVTPALSPLLGSPA